MIISKGLGTHTIHVRVNDPTELVIVDLAVSDSKDKTKQDE